MSKRIMAETFEYSSEDWDNSSNKLHNASNHNLIDIDRSKHKDIERISLFIS